MLALSEPESWHPRGLVAAALVLLLLGGGCGGSTDTATVPYNLTNGEYVGADTADSGSRGLIPSVVQLIRDAHINPGGSNFMIAVDYLNQQYNGTPAEAFRLGEAQKRYLSEKLGPKADSGFLDLESRTYTIRDSRHIEDCLLHASIARRVAGDGDDLTRARRVFEWLIRQVQVVPAGSLALPGLFQAPARPYDVLLRGMASEEGTWIERSWAFLALCRQLDLDAGILKLARPVPPADPAATEASAPPPPLVLAVAVLIEEVPYLFDCRIGLPIPGPDGEGIATFQQAVSDPRVLDQLDLPGQPYPVHQADLLRAGRVSVWLDSTLGYLTPRMRLFQNELTGRDRMVLFRDPSETDAAFAKALGDHFGGTEMWALPIDVETRLFTDPAFVQAAQHAMQYFDPNLPLMPARMAQLRGQLQEAVSSYGAFRFAERLVANDGKTPVPLHIKQVLDFHATYFLGLAKLDQGDRKLAANFFKQTLDQIVQFEEELQRAREELARQVPPDGSVGPLPTIQEPFFAQYRYGAISNLGVIAASRGDRDAALRYLAAPLPTGDAHGNQLRARALLWDDPFAR